MRIWRRISRSIPLAAKLNEFMFLSSVQVRSSSEPAGRTETLTSNRSEPFSISASEMPSSTTVCRSSCRKRRLLRRADVRLRDDLDERRAGPVEVDQRRARAVDPALGAADVQRLRRVLLEVRACDSDLGFVGPRQAQ